MINHWLIGTWEGWENFVEKGYLVSLYDGCINSRTKERELPTKKTTCSVFGANVGDTDCPSATWIFIPSWRLALNLQGHKKDLPMLDAHEAPSRKPVLIHVNIATSSENALDAVRTQELDLNVTAAIVGNPHAYGDVL